MRSRRSFAESFFQMLLRAFPSSFRDRFGSEISSVFQQELARTPAGPQRLSLVLRSSVDLMIAAAGVRREGLSATPATATAHGDVTVETVPPRQRKPLTHEQIQVSRRQFLNRAWTLSFFGFLGFFGMSSLSFLWPKLTGGFGTRIKAGHYEEILAKIGPGGGFLPLFVPDGRFYLVYYDGSGDSPVYELTGAASLKVQAIYKKCVHLGCSVPHCSRSMLFECPCHGSKYRLTGEHLEGPAPRGLDRFPIVVENGELIVDTGRLQVGPPRGTNTWPKFSGPVGEFCQPRA